MASQWLHRLGVHTFLVVVLRVVPRLLAIVVLTTFSGLVITASVPLRRVANGYQLRIRNAAYRLWARGFARVVGMRVEVTGTPPSGSFFLVSNHVGYMDIILLSTQLHTTFVAKADLNSWPVAGRAFAMADTIFVDRGLRRDVLRVVERVDREVDRGLGVVLFPEGTSSKGEEILRFKPSLLEFAARRDHPVHFATLSYSTPEGRPPAQDTVCWWGDEDFLPHMLRMLELPRFQARLVFGPHPVHAADRKVLADKLYTAMAAGFTSSS